jgi:hypothetical protein
LTIWVSKALRVMELGFSGRGIAQSLNKGLVFPKTLPETLMVELIEI